MSTITLCISDIVGSERRPDGVDVFCTYRSMVEPARTFVVFVDGHHVAVLEGNERPAESVLVSTTLVDATRRLFGLVGRA